MELSRLGLALGGDAASDPPFNFVLDPRDGATGTSNGHDANGLWSGASSHRGEPSALADTDAFQNLWKAQ
jgi:hypothetical protein